jgi:hypothetical protein
MLHTLVADPLRRSVGDATRTAAKRAFKGPFVPFRQASVRHFALPGMSSAATDRTLGTYRLRGRPRLAPVFWYTLLVATAKLRGRRLTVNNKKLVPRELARLATALKTARIGGRAVRRPPDRLADSGSGRARPALHDGERLMDRNG